jgi:hypothetical protein
MDFRLLFASLTEAFFLLILMSELNGWTRKKPLQLSLKEASIIK